MRAVRLAALAALVFATAGCGAKDKAASGGAELVPANAAAFVSIDSSLDSSQWRKVESLVRRFPDGDEALRMLRRSFENDSKLDWERDVKPALGDELDLVWLDLANGGQNVVAITKPKDEGKFRRAVEKANASDSSGDQVLIGELGDWLVLADAQGKIDRFKQQAPKGDGLADDQLYKDANEELPKDALVHAFVRGEGLTEALKRLPGAFPGVPLPLSGGKPEFIAAAVASEDQGIHAVARSRTDQELPGTGNPYDSKLLDAVPGDAIAFLSFRGGDGFEKQLQKLESQESYQEMLRELEQSLGFRLDRVTRLFKNEVALYVRRDAPIPEFTLLLEAPDQEEALDAVDDVLRRLTREQAAQPCHVPNEEAGVPVKCVSFDKLTIRYAAFDSKVVVTTGNAAISDLRSGGDRLGDAKAFRDARAHAGLPDKTNGFVWIDLKEVVPMILGFAAFDSPSSVPPEVQRNLEPLQSLTAWLTTEGPTSTSELFIEID